MGVSVNPDTRKSDIFGGVGCETALGALTGHLCWAIVGCVSRV